MDECQLKLDEVMVADVLSEKHGAFVILVKQYQNLVHHVVLRIVDNENDSEEICQDVFIKVYRQLSGFRFGSKLSTWISRIAYNTAIDFVKKRKIKTVDYDLSEIVDETNPAGVMDEMQLKDFVHKKMRLLTLIERTVLNFYHLEEMAINEISQVMQRPEGTVKSDLFRARKKLARMISAEERR